MSDELEQMSTSLFDNLVPKIWADVGFLSLKALAAWTKELNERIDFMNNWITKGTPKCIWISGFFFP